MLLGRSRWATKRTSDLSIPIPKAIVATTTTPSSRRKAILVPLPRRRPQTGVVGQRVPPDPAQPLGGVVDPAAREAVHDSGVAPVACLQEGTQLRSGALLGDDVIADVGAVEAADEEAGVPKPQPRHDLVAGEFVGGRGQRDPGHPRKALRERAQLQVLGTEVVSPLRHAVRFVDGDERHRNARQQLQGAFPHQPLGRDVEKVDPARPHRRLHGEDLAPRERRVEARGPDAGLPERLDLVAHQSDQRRDHDAHAVPHDPRNLVAERLAAPGGHEHQAVAPGHRMLDHGFLPANERGVPEDPPKDVCGPLTSNGDRAPARECVRLQRTRLRLS